MTAKKLGNWENLSELKGLHDLSSPPKEIYYSGVWNPEIFANCVAVVGSRRMTDYGRRAVEKIVTRISPQLHIITLKFTSFWEYARVADPVVVNILRDGVALIDSGFIEPLQALLRQGRIRPTRESVITYFSRAPVTLRNSRWHLLQATVDLYWSVIDAAHAALMHHHEVPPSPKHLSELFAERFVKTGMLEKKYAERVGKFYDLMKKIEHREIRNITGPEFERYYKEAEEFVNKIEVFIRMKKVK